MYKIDQKLGQGAFGIVYHLKLSNSSEFALKVVEIDRIKSHEIDPVTEARLMLKLTHAHLVQCCASFNHGRHIYLVMELCRHGTLKHFLNSRTKFVQEAQVLAWLGQMADALRYLHVCRVIHRDLKTDNVFLGDQRNVKIGDLGIARELDYTAQRAGTFIGTFCYMSPEVLQSSTYSYETDIWSLGCCIHEVMTLHQTFAAQSMKEVMENIMKAKIPLMPDIYSDKLQNLVVRMLDRKAHRRPDGLEVIFTVSKIQGFPFKSGCYIPLENVQINLKFLCKAVQDFEQTFSSDDETISHKGEPTIQPATPEEQETNTLESDIDYTDVHKEHCLKAKPRPLPLPLRYNNEDVPVGPEKEPTTKWLKSYHENSKNNQPSKQSHQMEHGAQVQDYSLDLALPHSSPANESKLDSSTSISSSAASTTHPSPTYESGFSASTSKLSSASSSHISSANEKRIPSTTLSSLSDSSSSNINTIAHNDWTRHTAETVKCSDDGVGVNRYMDHLATESRKWLRLKFGLPEDRSLEGQIIVDESDSESPVTLYTRAQMVKYSNRTDTS